MPNAGQSTATLNPSSTLTQVLGLNAGSTVRQAIGDLALQLIASPELAAVIGNYALFQGEWDASGGTFPSGATKGQFWRVSGADTVDGVAFAVSDVLLALADDASTTTYTDNWHRAGHASFAHGHTISDISGLADVASSGDSDDLTEGAAKLLMTTTERSKLAGVETGAQVNDVTSVAGRTGAVTLTASDVGLGNVDNTSDADKPVSAAQQTALDGKAAASHTHPVSDISDASAAGQALVTAASPAAQRTALGLVDVASSGDSDDLTEGTSKLLMTVNERAHLTETGTTPLPHARNSGRVPLAADAAGRVIAWAIDGEMDYAGRRSHAARIHTDGRDQSRYFSNSIKLKQGRSGELRFGLIGDSWTEREQIADALKTSLTTALGQSGDGFFSCKTTYSMAGYTLSSSGWTLYDASDGDAPSRSCGPDGHAAYTAGTSASWSVDGLDADRVQILYWDGDGTFRYRIDGGSWVAVAGASSDAVTTLELTGLAGAALVEIDVSTNAGTVEFYGIIADNPSDDGVTIYKIGNGSSMGSDWSTIKDDLAAWSSILDLDAVAIILGTNDTRYGGGYPDTLADGIRDIAAALRDSNPTMGVCYVAPPEHGDTLNGNGDFSDFREAAFAECDRLGFDYVNAAARWRDHTTENAAGFWSDTLHLDADGAARLVNYDILPHIYKES